MRCSSHPAPDQASIVVYQLLSRFSVVAARFDKEATIRVCSVGPDAPPRNRGQTFRQPRPRNHRPALR